MTRRGFAWSLSLTTPGNIAWRAIALIGATVMIMSAAHADGLGYDNLPPQELCGLCHGLTGISATARFPKLAGQKRAYIEKQLADFKAGRRLNGGGQMASVITEISEAQYPDVARYFSELPPPPPAELDTEMLPAETAAAARIVTDGDQTRGIPACATCHLSANAELPYAPHLTAQHPGYLEKQLNDFKSGARANDATGTMSQIAKLLTASEIQSLAAFLGSKPRETLAQNDQ
ncbi:MAG: cytochrome C [Pseudomonadota bacterium]